MKCYLITEYAESDIDYLADADVFATRKDADKKFDTVIDQIKNLYHIGDEEFENSKIVSINQVESENIPMGGEELLRQVNGYIDRDNLFVNIRLKVVIR